MDHPIILSVFWCGSDAAAVVIALSYYCTREPVVTEPNGSLIIICIIAQHDDTTTLRVHRCPPFYSSINFILLGLIAQHIAGRAAWEDFDQLGVIAPARRYLYDQTVFPRLGPCSLYPVSHQYAVAQVSPRHGRSEENTTVFHDVSDDPINSCISQF